MPQLDFSTYASQILWLFICFCILYFIMAKFALPQVHNVLSSRHLRISGDLAKAEKFKKEAESAKVDLASSLNEAKQKAHITMQRTHAELIEKAKLAHAALDAKFAIQEQESIHRQAQLKKDATEQMERVSSEIANHMLKKLIDIKVV